MENTMSNQSATLYVWENIILVRIDSRLTRAGYVFTYAPIAPNGRVDYSAKFEDMWDEVITLEESRRQQILARCD